MPLYSGGALDTGVASLQQFLGGQLVIETLENGTTRVYADDGQGGAPELTAEECALIGAALVALGAST